MANQNFIHRTTLESALYCHDLEIRKLIAEVRDEEGRLKEGILDSHSLIKLAISNQTEISNLLRINQIDLDASIKDLDNKTTDIIEELRDYLTASNENMAHKVYVIKKLTIASFIVLSVMITCIGVMLWH